MSDPFCFPKGEAPRYTSARHHQHRVEALLDTYDELDPFVTLAADTEEARRAYERWIDAINKFRAYLNGWSDDR